MMSNIKQHSYTEEDMKMMSKYPCECGFPRYDCELCHDTLICSEIHGEYGGEWEEEYRCPKCDPYDINEGLWTPNKPY